MSEHLRHGTRNLKASFVLAQNGPDHGLIRPARHGPVRSQVGPGIAVRLDTARKENWPGLAIPLPPRPGTNPHLLPSGSDPGGRRREVRREN